MPEQMDKIKEIIEDSKAFILAAKEPAEEHELLAREALKTFLKNKGSAVYEHPKNPDSFLDKWFGFIDKTKNILPLQKIAVRLPKGKAKIKEISYEDEGDFFSLNLEAEGGEISTKDIAVEQKPTAIDAVFLFAGADFGRLKKSLPELKLPEKEKAVFITKNDKTAAEKVWSIIQTSIDEDAIAKDMFSLLLASLLLEKIKSRKKQTEGTKSAEESFVRFGAEKGKVEKILSNHLSLDELPVV